MADFINVGGQLLPYDTAAIAPGDAGLLHGAGLFETMRVRRKKIFRITQHLDRLTRSAETLGISLSLGAGQLAEMAEELLDANGLTDARMRLTITRGDLHEVATGAGGGGAMPPVTLILSAAEFQAYPAQVYQAGMTVIVSRYKQNPENPLTGHKTTSYLDRLIALREAQQTRDPATGAIAGAGEALWFTAKDNALAEGSISNVFVVDKEGLLATPPLTLPGKRGGANQRLCLPGITRQVVLELATGLGILPHERMLTIEELLAAKEVFLTNSIMGVMPVTRVEKHVVGEGKVGELTGRLMTSYAQAVEDATA